MKMLKDSSEVREARDLLLRIMSGAPTVARSAPAVTPPPVPAPTSTSAALAGMVGLLPGLASDVTQRFMPPTRVPPPVPPPAWSPVEPAHPATSTLAAEVESLVSPHGASVTSELAEYASASRGGRLHALLSTLCDRESYAGALVTDARGLPLATSRNLEASDSLAAFSTVLGDVLTKAGSYLGQDDVSVVTLDLGEKQKVVLRRFFLEGHAFYLVVICLRLLDTRRVLDQTVHQILMTLGNA